MTDTRRTFNGTIPEPKNMSYDVTPSELFDALKSEQIAHYETAGKLIKAEQELRRQQRINRMLCRVIEGQAIKVTLKGVE